MQPYEVPTPKPQNFFLIFFFVLCFLFLLWIFGLIGGIYSIIYNVYLKNYHLCLIKPPEDVNEIGIFGISTLSQAGKTIDFEFYVTNTTDVISIYINGPRTPTDPLGLTQFVPDIEDATSFTFSKDVHFYKGSYRMSQSKSKELCEYFWKYSFIIEFLDKSINIPLGNQCISFINWV
jgi:hypothetical protein